MKMRARETVTRETVITMITDHRKQYSKTNDNIIDYERDEDIVEETLYEYSGCSNGFLAEIFTAFTGNKVEVIGAPVELFTCPCCGLKTLTELYDINEGTGYDICNYCFWEDDGTTDINRRTSINRGSINDYRKKISENSNYYYINKWFE